MGINQNQRLFQNEKIISWKGATLNEISLRYQQNRNQNTSKANIFLRPPIKLYRKETPYTTTASPSSSFRERRSVEDFSRPGGFSVSSSSSSGACLSNDPLNVLNPRPNLVNANNQSNCSDATNALRRVRSSGNLSKTYNSRNEMSYCTSTKQYLDSRQLSFAQNQFQYFRQGDATQSAGASHTKTNVYAAQGTTAQKYFLAADAQFTYFFPLHANNQADAWTLATRNVIVPGNRFYDVNDLNQVLFKAMATYGDVYVDPTYGNKFAYLSFSFNNVTNNVVIASFQVLMPSGSPYLNASNAPNYLYYPYISVAADNAFFANWVGFPTNASYPSLASATTRPASLSDVRYASSSMPFAINPTLFKPVYYKPANYQFAQDGGVSSSDRVLRLKYNTIRSIGATYEAPYGNQVANALSYYVNDRVFSLKDQVGFPLTKSPHVDAITGKVQCCNSLALKG